MKPDKKATVERRSKASTNGTREAKQPRHELIGFLTDEMMEAEKSKAEKPSRELIGFLTDEMMEAEKP